MPPKSFSMMSRYISFSSSSTGTEMSVILSSKISLASTDLTPRTVSAMISALRLHSHSELAS